MWPPSVSVSKKLVENKNSWNLKSPLKDYFVDVYIYYLLNPEGNWMICCIRLL